MRDRPPLSNLDEGIARFLRRLGLGDVRMLLALRDGWDGIAGRPWAGASRPLGITNGELLVESNDPGMVSMLRYATGGLVERIDEHFGTGKVDRVRVVPPPPSGPR